MSAAYLAPEGYERQLADELSDAGVAVARVHGRLFVTRDPPLPIAWSANTWLDPRELRVTSIGDAASQLRRLQRSWALYAPVHAGRARLIAERLPYVSARPLAWGVPAPSAPLGSWTLLAPDLVLASPSCTSPFPNGEARFVEDHEGPPSRAYLKLWEAFVRLGLSPGPGDRCLDLGASPGGWTWLLARLGAHVIAVDKAPLAPSVARLPGVEWRCESAFALDPRQVGAVDWLCSDVIAYPRRLYRLVERWLAAGQVRNLVCTVKLQGEADRARLRAFAELPDAQLFHLHHNKHELTLAVVSPP